MIRQTRQERRNPSPRRTKHNTQISAGIDSRRSVKLSCIPDPFIEAETRLLLRRRIVCDWDSSATAQPSNRRKCGRSAQQAKPSEPVRQPLPSTISVAATAPSCVSTGAIHFISTAGQKTNLCEQWEDDVNTDYKNDAYYLHNKKQSV